MNTANLQLEGLVMAIAAITQALVAKGVLTTEEVDDALAVIDETAIGGYRTSENLSPASLDAIAFPVRLLRTANKLAIDGTPPFAELARMVGSRKDDAGARE